MSKINIICDELKIKRNILNGLNSIFTGAIR